MYKDLIVLLVFIGYNQSFAIGGDSLVIKKNLNQQDTTLPQENDTVRMAMQDSLLSVNGDSTISLSAETEGEYVTQDFNIVSFEADSIPLDSETFYANVSTLGFQVPMHFNPYVKRQIDYFGTSWQIRLKEMITKSDYFFPKYEEVLTEYNLPLEIKYLSVIESGLNPYAKSRTGAMGPWQFMPATARIFKLKMTNDIDERRSIEKSTKAAAKYLIQMYNQYGDWLVALASYNCGPGNVRKAMRNSGSTDFWGMYNHLPRETQNYVPKFMAMSYMMNFYYEYGITPAPIEDSLFTLEAIYCDGTLEFKTLAKYMGLSNDHLLKCNPELKTYKIPKKEDGYLLSVPLGSASLFYENEDTIRKESAIKLEEARKIEASRPKVNYHYVRKGETLSHIARRYGVSVSQLKKWNRIKGSTIYPKQRLKIYRN